MFRQEDSEASDASSYLFFISTGLDPVAHTASPQFLDGRMDGQVKPGHDNRPWIDVVPFILSSSSGSDRRNQYSR